MTLPEFLDLGSQLEVQVSKNYELLAGLATDEAVAKRFRSLAAEELNHANILRTGKNYYAAMPDVFAGTRLADVEIRAAFKEAAALGAGLSQGVSLAEGVRRMLALERDFERVHLDASVGFNERSLKELFAGLRRGDQNHVAVLEEIAVGFGET